MSETLVLARGNWTGANLSASGVYACVIFVLAIVLLALSSGRHPKVAHFSRWFLWFALVQGLLFSVELALDRRLFLNRPRYLHWLSGGLQELVMICFIATYMFRYKKAFPKPNISDAPKENSCSSPIGKDD